MADSQPTAWICTACGYIHEGDAPPANCPLCAVPRDCFVPHTEPGDEPAGEDGVMLDDEALDDIMLDDAILGGDATPEDDDAT